MSLVGLIGGNQEQAAPSTPPPRTVNGATLDTVFIHHATPKNISGNSTYLDSPLTDGNPNAVLVVTQNWNPGGTYGKYNNHPIGVWYDRSKWAIFNQDRAASRCASGSTGAFARRPAILKCAIAFIVAVSPKVCNPYLSHRQWQTRHQQSLFT